MNHNKYLPVMLVSIFIILTSCTKDWLDVKENKTQAVPSTLDDFQALLDLSTKMNANIFGYGEIAADGHSVTDAVWSTASNSAKNCYSWTHTLLNTNVTNWQLIYNRIFNDNVVLDGLTKVNPSSTDEQERWNDVKGQALLNRAYAFFSLSQNFAAPFNASSATTDLGISLRLNSDITEVTARSSVKQTYDQIINDLKEAMILLPNSPLFPTRGGKGAAYALLARTYLLISNYDSALVYSNKYLQLSNILIDYNNLSTSASYIVPIAGKFNPEVIFYDIMYTSAISNFLTTNYRVDTSLFNQYASSDLRKMLFFKNSSGIITFKGNYNNSTTDLFAGTATDEMYLIRAECYARTGNTTLAMKDLNDLLRTRWKKISGVTTYVDQTATTADEALSIILTERRKELILRGLRWSDLRRLNQDDRFKVTLTRTIGGQTYTLEPNSYKYTFPIPDDIIQQTGIQQNPGW